MKMRMMFLAGVGAVALVALAGSVGFASATVLCKTETDPCTSTYGVGTELKAQLKAGTKLVLKAGFATAECTGASLVEKVENAGGSTSSVTGSVSTRDFSSCNCEVKTLKGGTTHYHRIPGTYNLTITESNSEVTVGCSGVSCTYGGAVDIGEYTAFPVAEWHIHEEMQRVSGGFLCANPATMTATFEMTAPEPMYGATS